MLTKQIPTGDFVLTDLPKDIDKSPLYNLAKPVQAVQITHNFRIVQDNTVTAGTGGDYIIRPQGGEKIYAVPQYLFRKLFVPEAQKAQSNSKKRDGDGKSE